MQCVLMKILLHASEKKDTKRVSNFTLLLTVFKGYHSSKGVNDDALRDYVFAHLHKLEQTSSVPDLSRRCFSPLTATPAC